MTVADGVSDANTGGVNDGKATRGSAVNVAENVGGVRTS